LPQVTLRLVPLQIITSGHLFVRKFVLAESLLNFRRMKFSIEVGDREKHVIEFHFNQLLGKSIVSVDGETVFRKKRWFSEPLVDRYNFEVGYVEPVHVRIEKERKLIFSSKYRIYVDNRLTQLYQGV
jgi:hypothetical protein